VLFPALRLGYLVVPPDLVDAFVNARALLDRHSPILEQVVLADLVPDVRFTASGDGGDSPLAARVKGDARMSDVIDKAVADPDPATREAMQRGAYWSGRAIDISKTTAAHALSYLLTARHGVPHGHAVAMVFPYVAACSLAHLRDSELSSLCERFDPRRISGLVPLPDFCRARGLNFFALAADLLASVDPARLANNPVKMPTDLFV
jgi:hypothetical protein